MNHGYVYDLLRSLGLTQLSAETGQFLLDRPLRILCILLGASIGVRLAARGARRVVASVRRRSPRQGSSARADQRAGTITDALVNMARVVIWAMALLMVVDQFGVNLAPLVAGAGIAGVALGFGAQSLVKDFLSGLFILVEDQYGVGDVVSLVDTTGTVEEVNLRVTRLRGIDGTVYFVPNGEIRKVANSSMEWSLALLDVVVGFDADVAAVSRSLQQEAAAFAAEPEHEAQVLDEPQVWGVQSMTAEGVVVRLSVKTAARQQWLVARDLRTRLGDRLRREGVPGPGGKAVLVTAGGLDKGTPVPPPTEVGKAA